MELGISCRYCGSPVSFAEEDRGHEVYCNSCGRANPIPVDARSQAASPTKAGQELHVEIVRQDDAAEQGAATGERGGVFSADTVAELQHEVVAHEICLCGGEVPVRIEDFGASVYCHSCGTEIRVGDAIEGAKFRVARAAATTTDPTLASDAREPARRRFQRLVPILIVLAVAVATVACVALRDPAIRSAFVGKWFGSKLTSLRVEVEVPVDGTSSQTTAPHAEAKVTLAEIERLLQYPDPMAALLQARFWLQTLREDEDGETGPRPAKLREVIQVLERKLTPPPEPLAPEIGQFQAAVERMAARLKNGDSAAAQKASFQAKILLRRHAEKLAPYRGRYETLEERLASELEFSASAGACAALLQDADRHQAAGRVTEALEAEVDAQYLASITPLSKAEAETLDRLDRELKPRLRLARGRRAADDAQRCAAAGDVAGRNREVRRALALLPGLPENQVQPLLRSLEPWRNHARTESNQTREAKPASKIAEEIQRRDCYEQVLAHYGAGETLELVNSCRNLKSLIAETSEQAMLQGAERRLFDALESEIQRLLDTDEAEAKLDDRGGIAERAAQARMLLEHAELWNQDPRWTMLDALVSQMQTGSE